MLEQIFAITMSLRESPDETSKDGKILTSKLVEQYHGESYDLIIANKDCGLTSKKTLSGWTFTIENKTQEIAGFFIDFNSDKVDIQKPCRVKIKSPSKLKDQIETQSQEEPSLAYNKMRYKNSVSFDVIDILPKFTLNDESTYIWNVSVPPSTPFMKHSVAMKLDPNEKVVFEVSFTEAADLNYDLIVDSKDLAILLDNWGKPYGDIDGDGNTNANDQSILLDSFKSENEQDSNGN